MHAWTDPQNFALWRLSPTITRPLVEWIYKRDAYGRLRISKQMVSDFFLGHVPIPLQGMIGKREMTFLQSVLQSMGISSYQYRTKLDKVMMDYYVSQMKNLPGDSEEAAINFLRSRYMKYKREGDEETASALLEKAVDQYDVPPKVLAKWVRSSRIDKKVAGFARLPLDVQVKALKVATPEEAAKLRPLYSRKRAKTSVEQKRKANRELMKD